MKIPSQIRAKTSWSLNENEWTEGLEREQAPINKIKRLHLTTELIINAKEIPELENKETENALKASSAE